MIKEKFLLVGVFVLCFILAGGLAEATVGVGISPTKYVWQMEGGKTQELTLKIYNIGDDAASVSLLSNGDISSFTKIEPINVIIQPEPVPHTFPIKNGKDFVVKFTPPINAETKTYTGTITATGTSQGGAQLGGSVAVGMQVELTVVPPAKQPLLNSTQLLIIGVIFEIIILIIIIFLLRKLGYTLRFKRES